MYRYLILYIDKIYLNDEKNFIAITSIITIWGQFDPNKG